MAAEGGATEAQMMALFGWRSSFEAVWYTRAANRTILAGDAMSLLALPAAPLEPAAGNVVRLKRG